MIDISTVLPPRRVDPDSEIGRLFTARGYSLDLQYHRVMATRRMAREIAHALPAAPVTLDCAHVEVMSTSFLHELRTLRPDVTFERMNEDVAECWAIVNERLNGDAR